MQLAHSQILGTSSIKIEFEILLAKALKMKAHSTPIAFEINNKTD